MPLFSWFFHTPKITNNTNTNTDTDTDTDNTKSCTDPERLNSSHKRSIDPSEKSRSQTSMWPIASVRPPEINSSPTHIATNKFAEQSMWPTAQVRTSHTIKTKQATTRKRH
jgi:hypothetical protein